MLAHEHNPPALNAVRITYTDKPEVSFFGQVTNVSSGSIKLLFPEPFTKGARVLLEFVPGATESGTVFYSNSEGSGFLTSIEFQPKPHRPVRQLERTEINEPAVVAEIGPASQTRLVARAVDISQNGVGLMISQEFAIGALLRVELKQVVLFGEVRHCRFLGNGRFRIGLLSELNVPISQKKVVSGSIWC